MYKATAASTSAIPLGPFINGSGSPLGGLAILDTQIWITSNGSKVALGTSGSTVVTTDSQGVAFFPASYVTALLAAAGYFRIDVQATGALTYWEDVIVVAATTTTPTPTPGTPYVLDLPAVTSDLNITLANFISVRAQISANPKPSYRVHGHDYDWVGLYKLLSAEIENVTRQLNQLAPWEIISAGR